MLNCCIEHKKKREQLHKGYTGDIQMPASPFRGPSTSQVSRSMSHEESINRHETVSLDSSLGACAIEEENPSDVTINRRDGSKNKHETKNRKDSSAISSESRKRNSVKFGSSEESSEDEFFECNDDKEETQSDEKDVDTMTETENQSQESTNEMEVEEEEEASEEIAEDNGKHYREKTSECLCYFKQCMK